MFNLLILPISQKFYQESSRYDINKFKNNDIAGLRHQGGASISNDGDFGQWEAHTKGIGSKLLAKMGYVAGQGLGKHGQGISKPIEAKKRSSKAAVGSDLVDDEYIERKKRDKTDEIVFKKESNKPASSGSSRPVKYVFKTVEEIIAETEAHTKEDPSISKVSIIDLRGPRPREYFGYNQISLGSDGYSSKTEFDDGSKQVEKVEDIPLPPQLTLEDELSRVMNDIKKHYSVSKTEKERIKDFKNEVVDLEERIEKDKNSLESLEKMFKVMKNMSSEVPSSALKVEELVLFCDDICDSCHRFGHPIEVSDVIKSFCFPAICRYLQNWKVIEDPLGPLRIISNFRKTFYSIDETLFDCLMWDIWMPIVRRSITQWPSIRQYEELISFFEIWKPYVQEWLIAHLLSQIVIPKLEREVQDWNPLDDQVPVHSWIHPWLPLMVDHSLETVYTPLKTKLANALVKWHPSDKSARTVLEPWKSVFDSASWSAFLTKNIAPKLENTLDELVINPSQQTLDQWTWFIDWQDMFPREQMVSMLVKGFFPKWLDALYRWLTRSPNFEEVSRWYLGWKSVFPQSFLDHKKVQDALTIALEMINHALSSPVGMFDYTFSTLSTPIPQDDYTTQSEKPKTIYFSDLNNRFEELVERRSAEMALSYNPHRNKYVDQFQVYRFGKLSVYIDHLALFYSENDSWIPITIDDLCKKVCKT